MRDHGSLTIESMTVERLRKLVRSIIAEDGLEYPNPEPAHVDVTPRPPTLQEQIRRILRTELSDQVAAQGGETFEEALDFDVDEEPELRSPYEVAEMEDEYPVQPPSEEVVEPSEPAAELPVEDGPEE